MKRLENPHDRRTCQCCGRQIMANTGVIAHHGYQRPQGWGCQTASCMGAKRLPYEAGRARLGDLISLLERNMVDLRAHRAKVVADAIPLRFEYTKHRAGMVDEHWVEVTRDTFDEVRPAYEIQMRRSMVSSFDDLQRRELADTDRKIEQVRRALHDQRRRFAAWWPLEVWVGDGWAPVSADNGHFLADGVTS